MSPSKDERATKEARTERLGYRGHKTSNRSEDETVTLAATKAGGASKEGLNTTRVLSPNAGLESAETQMLLLDRTRSLVPELQATVSDSNSSTPGLLGGFQVVSLLGYGGNGGVYRALDSSGTEVALKTLTHPNAQANKRFEAEGRLLQLLGGKGFPTFIAGDFSSPTPWFAMELIEGVTIKEAVDYVGASSVKTVLRVAREVARALLHLHSLGYSHRDVKPSNIILGSGRATLLDVGIAKGEQPGEETTAWMGSFNYAAPERFRGESGTPKCDVYGLGLTMLYLNTGEAPFAGKNPAEITSLVHEGKLDLSNLDPKLCTLIKEMTSLETAARLEMKQVIVRIESLLSTEAAAIAPSGSIEAPRVHAPAKKVPDTEETWIPRPQLAQTLLGDPALLADLTDCHLRGYDGASIMILRHYLEEHRINCVGLTSGWLVNLRDEIWTTKNWKIDEHAGKPSFTKLNTYLGWKNSLEGESRY